MSLFQCQNCGCCENTALSHQGFTLYPDDLNWTGKENLKGLKLCSACGPSQFKGGSPLKYGGKWHGQFRRIFLPTGMFKTNKVGNLEHLETGSEDISLYEIAAPEELVQSDQVGV